MGYTITIGQPEFYACEERQQIIYHVADIEHPEAPNDIFSIMGHSNNRYWGYKADDQLNDAIGISLGDFVPEDFQELSPPALLTKEHQAKINNTYGRFLEQYGNHNSPIFYKKAQGFIIEINLELNKARLEWLKFWINYAVDNFDVPAIYIS